MKSYILATLAITPLFLTTLADGTSTIKYGYKSIPPTGPVAVLNHGPMRPADWRDHLSDWNTVSKRDAEHAKANLHDPANWRKPASPPGKSVSKRGEWEDEYNYAVTWTGTETAGQYRLRILGGRVWIFMGCRLVSGLRLVVGRVGVEMDSLRVTVWRVGMARLRVVGKRRGTANLKANISREGREMVERSNTRVMGKGTGRGRSSSMRPGRLLMVLVMVMRWRAVCRRGRARDTKASWWMSRMV